MGNHVCKCLLNFRVTARRLRWRRGTDLLSLPPEILHSIMKNMGENQFGDLCRAKAICSTIRDVADDEIFIRDVDLLCMVTPWAHLSGVRKFYEKCLEAGNPSALYMRGAWDYFMCNRKEEGILRIRLAAERRYTLVVYAYANISRILKLGDDLTSDVSRDFIREAKILVDDAHTISWPPYPLPIEIEELIPVSKLYHCSCCITNLWEDPWNEGYKQGIMCDSCFWTIQTLWFYREFPKKIRNWPQENEFEDSLGNWGYVNLWTADYETLWMAEGVRRHEYRHPYWIKFLVFCLLLFVACFLSQLL